MNKSSLSIRTCYPVW